MLNRHQVRRNFKPFALSPRALLPLASNGLAIKANKRNENLLCSPVLPVLLLSGFIAVTPVYADDFHFELNASVASSNLSIEPGVAFGAKASAYDLWFSGEYLLQTGIENTSALGGQYDTDSVVLKAGYDWYLEDNMAFTPYAGFGLTFDDIEYDPNSGQIGYLYESGAWQIFAGLSVTLKLNESFLFTAGAAFLPGYDRDESQTLLSFTVSWRPFASFSSTQPTQPRVESPLISESPFEELPESSSEPDDMASMEEPPSTNDEFIDLETFDDPEPEPAPARQPLPARTPPTRTAPPPRTESTVRTPPPSSSPVMQQGAASDTIAGIRIIEADAVTFQYGIQMAWLPSKSSAGEFITKARSKVDVSAMFITQAKDGFRIYYEGFNDFGAAKKVLTRIRQSFSDAFIKKIK